MKTWILTHPAYAALIAGWLFSNIIASLPSPNPGERWYGAFHKFLQLTAGNAARVIPALRFSQDDKSGGTNATAQTTSPPAAPAGDKPAV